MRFPFKRSGWLPIAVSIGLVAAVFQPLAAPLDASCLQQITRCNLASLTIASAQYAYTVLHDFDPAPNGIWPYGGMVLGSDGNFYGTTAFGGEYNNGVVYSLTASGELTVLHSFNGADGESPDGKLIQGGDGSLYGTTMKGGLSYGVVYKITTTGTYTVLHTFNGVDGARPFTGLAVGSDGDFYGTTAGDGTHNDGTFFRISASGAFTLLHTYTGTGTNDTPGSALTLGSDGNFYGTTSFGGTDNNGAFFTITPGGALTVLYSFTNADGNGPQSLTLGQDGNFYGEMAGGGDYGYGTVFVITPTGTLTILHELTAADGSPGGGLTEDGNDSFYGNTGGLLFNITSTGAFTVLHRYSGEVGPLGPLVLGSDGDLYGAAYGGPGNVGVIFKATTSGTVSTVYTFAMTDGGTPSGALIQASDGNYYGTTTYGGKYNDGIVFRITPDGVLTPLHEFTGTDGANPVSCLSLGADGTLYGTTRNGGTGSFGTVFKVTTGGAFTSLYSFNTSTGGNPIGGVILATNGFLYGTTSVGGSFAGGTVFRLSTSGVYTTLWSFSNESWYGYTPEATLVQVPGEGLFGTTFGGSGDVFKITQSGDYTWLYNFGGNEDPSAGLTSLYNGYLYGTTTGGDPFNAGTVYRISPGGLVSDLYYFSGPDGAVPTGALLVGSDGNLWGTTSEGGTLGGGTVFKMTPDGSILTTMHSFGGTGDGASPYAGLVEGTDLNVYGTTAMGGAHAWGTVYALIFTPSAPTGLTATAKTNMVALSWHRIPGATSYNIYREDSAGDESPTAIAAGITATTFTNTGLTSGSTYYYDVAAVNAGGTSALSAEVAATLLAMPPLDVTATTQGNQAAVKWKASAGATSYRVYWLAPGWASYRILQATTALSCTAPGLGIGKAYSFEVAAVDAGGTSASSSPVTVTPLAPPTGLTATAGDASVKLAWTASAGAASYSIYRGATSGGEGAMPIKTGITPSSYTDTGLKNGVRYFYKIAAVNAGGASALSGEISAKPEAGH